MRFSIILACVPLAAASLAAQSASDIWLADIVERDGQVALANVRRVTDHPGYDNQPRFTVEGNAILYTSYRDGQSDIWRYDIASGRHTQVTHTPESEYSPTQQPEGHGRLAAVRVGRDSTQQLWTFAPDGTDFQILEPTLNGIAYYAWFPEDHLVAVMLGDSLRMDLVDLLNHAHNTITLGIGPTLYVVPEDPSVLYAARDGERFQLVAWSPMEADNPLALGPLPDGPYFVLDPAHEVVFAPRGGEITALAMRNASRGYQPVAGLDGLGLMGITRMTVSLDGTLLAFVAAEH